jgi:hypothetical protein
LPGDCKAVKLLIEACIMPTPEATGFDFFSICSKTKDGVPQLLVPPHPSQHFIVHHHRRFFCRRRAAAVPQTVVAEGGAKIVLVEGKVGSESPHLGERIALKAKTKKGKK